MAGADAASLVFVEGLVSPVTGYGLLSDEDRQCISSNGSLRDTLDFEDLMGGFAGNFTGSDLQGVSLLGLALNGSSAKETVSSGWVGEAANPGPGGSQVTKRQRQEKFLLEGLQALFSRLEDLDQDEQEEEPWQTQRRRRPKGGNSATIRQLQQLIVDCQSHGAQGIIGKLRGILNGSGGRAGLGLLPRLVALLMLEMSLQAHIALVVCLLWCVLTFQLLFRRAGATSGYSSTLESGDRPVLRHSQGLFPSQACDQVLQASGERGVFFSAVRNKNAPAPSGVRWLPRDDKVTAEVYLQTAQKQAAAAAAPLAFRRGGRASLGIGGEGTTTTVAESSSLRLRWAAKSVPRHWSPTQFRRMLDAQAWRVVADLQPPARPGGVWTFAAARPEGRSEDCFVLSLEGKSIVIVPWKRVSKGWASLSGTRKAQEAGDAAALGEAAGTTDIDAGAGVDDDGDATGDEHMEGQGAKRPAQAPAQEQHRQAPKARWPNRRLVRGKVRTEFLCGITAAMVATAAFDVWRSLRRFATGWTLLRPRRRQKSWLRVFAEKLHFWMDGRKGWREAWSQDPGATALTEGGEVATTPHDYLASVLRRTKWTDHYLVYAASRVLECDVIVWKHMAGQWKFMSRVAPPTSVKGRPICLYLMDEHFTTLAHDADIPSTWSELARTAEGEYIPYHGGGKRKQADVEEASVCSSSLSHWLRPVRLGGLTALAREDAASSLYGDSGQERVTPGPRR
ncbi:unnamed protein product [Symbiodinium sp. CCMP2592]|nr:unnamed protein product [Symbiodinium sp. CCMP2592]